MTHEQAEPLPWEAAFARGVLRLRESGGLSQSALAKELSARGVTFHQTQVRRVEVGERPVRLNEAFVFAQVLAGGDLEVVIEAGQVEDDDARRLELAVESARQTLAGAWVGVRDGWRRAESAIAGAETLADVAQERGAAADPIDEARSLLARLRWTAGHLERALDATSDDGARYVEGDPSAHSAAPDELTRTPPRSLGRGIGLLIPTRPEVRERRGAGA